MKNKKEKIPDIRLELAKLDLKKEKVKTFRVLLGKLISNAQVLVTIIIINLDKIEHFGNWFIGLF